MIAKSTSSTQAQNNFGQLLDDVTHNHTCYIVERRGAPQALVISIDDFVRLLNSRDERLEMNAVMREIRPEYNLGRVVYAPSDSD